MIKYLIQAGLNNFKTWIKTILKKGLRTKCWKKQVDTHLKEMLQRGLQHALKLLF